MEDIARQMETRENPSPRWDPRDLVECSNHWATGYSVVSKGDMWLLTRMPLRIHIVKFQTASRSNIKAFRG